MFTVRALVFTFYLFIYCDASFVDTLPQCNIEDGECFKEVYKYVVDEIVNKGDKELGISPVDPMKFTNVHVTLMKGLTMNVTEGTVKGIAKCVFNKLIIDWRKERGILNATCEALSIKADFVVSGENAEFQNLLGSDNLNGQGRAKIKLENTNVNIEFSICLIKKDGDIYIQISNKNTKYTYDIGNMHFITENVIIANNDFSQILQSHLNSHWREAMEQFGSVFIDEALKILIGLVANISDKIPTSKFITGDLTSYLKE